MSSPNSICTATAGIEAIVAQSLGEDKISVASSRWMLSSFEDQNATRTHQSNLEKWGAKRLSKLTDSQRQSEAQRMEAGREAAENAMRDVFSYNKKNAGQA